MYLARGLTDVGRPQLGDDEEADLATRWVPLADAVRMVFSGEIVNATTAAGLLAAHALVAGPASSCGRPTRPGRTARRGSPSAARLS